MSKYIATNAPDSYDYRTTTEVFPLGDLTARGTYPVRVVRIEDAADAEYQRDRDLSGLYIADLYEVTTPEEQA